MRNATIATSRTRAASEKPIAYRPLPAAWGDVEALHAVRAAKARAAEQGLDPSTLALEATTAPESTRPTTRDTAATGSRPAARGRRLIPRHHRRHLATV